MRLIQRCTDSTAVAAEGARLFSRLAEEAILSQGCFRMALSGGNTPQEMYRLLANEPLRQAIRWDKIHLFFGDERSVPPDHLQSNYRMVRETLLLPLAFPDKNIHRMQPEIGLEKAAHAYEHILQTEFNISTEAKKNGVLPHFDLVLLGLGEEGHTASLFPGTKALEEDRRWVVPNYVPALKTWRLTLTLPVINSARQIIFMAAGVKKAFILRQVFANDEHKTLPAQMVQPQKGEVIWIIDEAAAAQLPTGLENAID
jgi:6-phosphogluconolactonase